ncbi:MAG: autotransporter outer membrane beta-barrel domain-containing protein [Candidatus Pelagibacter sp.]
MYGFAFRFGSDDIDVGSFGSALDTNAFSLTAYETRPSGENIFMDSLIGISAMNINLLNNSGSVSTDGKREGKQIFTSIKIRETFTKKKLNVTPNIKLDLGLTSLSDYTETGAEGLNLKFNKQNIGTIITSIGSAIDNTIQIDKGVIKPNIQLEYNADISPSSKQEFEYASNGTSFILENINSSTHNYRGNFGFDIILNNGLSLITSYERNQSKDNGHSDAIYFAGSYVLNKDELYTFSLDGSETLNTKLDYKRNMNGFDIKISSNYTFRSIIPDYGTTLKISNTF